MGSYVFDKSDFDANGELKLARPVSPSDIAAFQLAYFGDTEALWIKNACLVLDEHGNALGSAEAAEAERKEQLDATARAFGGLDGFLDFLDGDGDSLAEQLLRKQELDQLDLASAAGDDRSEALPALLIKGTGGRRNRVIVGEQAIKDYLKSNGVDADHLDMSRYERTTIRGVLLRPDFKISDYKQAFTGEMGLNPIVNQIIQKHPERAQYVELGRLKAREYGLNENMFLNQLAQESGFNPNIVSSAGAAGIGQLMPGTARALGVRNAYDALENIDGAARLMRKLTVKYGSQEAALVAYNGGDGAVLYAMKGLGIYDPKNLKPEMLAAFYAQERIDRRRAGKPLGNNLWCVQSGHYLETIAGITRIRPDSITAGKPDPETDVQAATTTKLPAAAKPANGAGAGGQPAQTPPAAAAGKPGDPPAVAAAAQSVTDQVPPPPKPRVAASVERELEPA